MTDVVIKKTDDVHIRIHADPGIKMELAAHFTFEVPGYKFMPAYKNGTWDGKIRLFHAMSGQLYTGLVDHVKDFCSVRGYDIMVDPALEPDEIPEDIGYGLAKHYKTKYEPRYYQADTVHISLSHKRAILLSATSSGKSFSIYLIVRYLQEIGKRILIVVPTTSLVRQMHSDFVDYNNGELPFSVSMIEGTKVKDNTADLVIATWQGIHRLSKDWFDEFDAVIGDECHSFKAKSLIGIMEKCTDCEYKLGFTGTLDGAECNELVLQGLFGKKHHIIDVATLIADGTLVDFKIFGMVLNYPEWVKKALRKSEYKTEMDYIVQQSNRNLLIRNLARKINGNTLILYEYVEKHGSVLYDLLKSDDHIVLFVSGKDSTDYREDVRRITEENDNVIIIASYGVFRQGINIVNIDNLIFASPTKSKIRFMQSIGRVLRRGINNTKSTLYDIADDLSIGSYENHTLRHFRERIKTYAIEGLKYSIINMDIEDNERTK